MANISKRETSITRAGTLGTGNGDMSATREAIREKASVARDLIQSHPLTPELSAKLFAQKGIGTFRFSAALIKWSQSELEGLPKIWVQAYKNVWHVPWSSANSLYTLPTAEGGKSLPKIDFGTLYNMLMIQISQDLTVLKCGNKTFCDLQIYIQQLKSMSGV